VSSPELAGKIRDGRHVLPVRVYYEDTDFSGVVYHASYLRFMERGRTDYLRLLGIDHRGLFEPAGPQAAGYAFVVRSMQIEFLKPARMDDVLEIVTAPEEVKGASIVLGQRVARDGETLVDAKVRFALVAGNKARRIPEALRIAIESDRRAHSSDDPPATKGRGA
jgi:acyl-CoA thioester hydrolase